MKCKHCLKDYNQQDEVYTDFCSYNCFKKYIKKSLTVPKDLSILIDMKNDDNISFRKRDDGKFMAIIRGGRGERVFKSKVSYNRKHSKRVDFD